MVSCNGWIYDFGKDGTCTAVSPLDGSRSPVVINGPLKKVLEAFVWKTPRGKEFVVTLTEDGTLCRFYPGKDGSGFVNLIPEDRGTTSTDMWPRPIGEITHAEYDYPFIYFRSTHAGEEMRKWDLTTSREVSL